MKLSQRLQALADLIDKHHQGNVLADIGSDHAYLPCYLVQNKIIKKAYACDIVAGPCQAAKQTIKRYHLNNSVEVLLGTGLTPIVSKTVDNIVIAGMGAFLISEILEEQRDEKQILFLQPNANSNHLRKYLFKNNYQFVDERIIEDGKHLYEMMAVKKISKKIDYNEYDIEFGPILRYQKSTTFIKKWQKQLIVYQKIKQSLPTNHPRYIELAHKIKMIEVILNESF